MNSQMKLKFKKNSQKNLGFWFYLLFTLLFSQTIFAESNSDWKEWLKTYGATTPIGSMRKTSQWFPTDEDFSKIQNEGKMVTIKTFETFEMSWDAIYAHPLLKITNRDKMMVKNIRKLIENRKKTELLIIFTGAAHAFDFFFSEQNQSVNYISFPLSSTSKEHSEDYDRYLKLISEIFKSTKTDNLKKDLEFEKLINTYYLCPLLALHRKISTGKKIKIKDITNSQLDDNSGNIIIMDIHGLDETSVFEKMPSPDSIKELGFESITVAVEDFDHGKNISLETLEDFVSISQLSFLEMARQLRKLYTSYRVMNKPDALLKKLAEAIEMLESGKIEKHPTSVALVKKIKEYSKTLPLRITGLL